MSEHQIQGDLQLLERRHKSFALSLQRDLGDLKQEVQSLQRELGITSGKTTPRQSFSGTTPTPCRRRSSVQLVVEAIETRLATELWVENGKDQGSQSLASLTPRALTGDIEVSDQTQEDVALHICQQMTSLESRFNERSQIISHQLKEFQEQVREQLADFKSTCVGRSELLEAIRSMHRMDCYTSDTLENENFNTQDVPGTLGEAANSFRTSMESLMIDYTQRLVELRGAIDARVADVEERYDINNAKRFTEIESRYTNLSVMLDALSRNISESHVRKDVTPLLISKSAAADIASESNERLSNVESLFSELKIAFDDLRTQVSESSMEQKIPQLMIACECANKQLSGKLDAERQAREELAKICHASHEAHTALRYDLGALRDDITEINRSQSFSKSADVLARRYNQQFEELWTAMKTVALDSIYCRSVETKLVVELDKASQERSELTKACEASLEVQQEVEGKLQIVQKELADLLQGKTTLKDTETVEQSCNDQHSDVWHAMETKFAQIEARIELKNAQHSSEIARRSSEIELRHIELRTAIDDLKQQATESLFEQQVSQLSVALESLETNFTTEIGEVRQALVDLASDRRASNEVQAQLERDGVATRQNLAGLSQLQTAVRSVEEMTNLHGDVENHREAFASTDSRITSLQVNLQNMEDQLSFEIGHNARELRHLQHNLEENLAAELASLRHGIDALTSTYSPLDGLQDEVQRIEDRLFGKVAATEHDMHALQQQFEEKCASLTSANEQTHQQFHASTNQILTELANLRRTAQEDARRVVDGQLAHMTLFFDDLKSRCSEQLAALDLRCSEDLVGVENLCMEQVVGLEDKCGKHLSVLESRINEVAQICVREAPTTAILEPQVILEALAKHGPVVAVHQTQAVPQVQAELSGSALQEPHLRPLAPPPVLAPSPPRWQMAQAMG